MDRFDFSSFPVLITPRLVLRLATAEDAADLLAYRGDPEVAKYDSPDTPMKDLAEAAAAIMEARKSFEARKAIEWSITLKDEQRVIGDVVFFFYEQAYYKANLGYGLARPYWRQAIASEAVWAAVKFGFEQMGLHRINVDTRMDNLASVRLMEKLGFRHEGVRRECVRNHDGTYQSWGLYGLLEDEYIPAVK